LIVFVNESLASKQNTPDFVTELSVIVTNGGTRTSAADASPVALESKQNLLQLTGREKYLVVMSVVEVIVDWAEKRPFLFPAIAKTIPVQARARCTQTSDELQWREMLVSTRRFHFFPASRCKWLRIDVAPEPIVSS
jgi:hypothetical protein